jgi:hypothetical protein
LSASACKACSRMPRSTGSLLAKSHNASTSAAEVSNGATNPQSSSWSRRLRPNAPASVAVFCRVGNVGVSSTNHSAARKARIWSCRNSRSAPIDRMMPKPSLSNACNVPTLTVFRHPVRLCAGAASSSSKRAAPALRGGEVVHRVRQHAPTSPGTTLRDRPATSRARDGGRRDRRGAAGRSRRRRCGTGPPPRCGGTISHPSPRQATGRAGRRATRQYHREAPILPIARRAISFGGWIAT